MLLVPEQGKKFNHINQNLLSSLFSLLSDLPASSQLITLKQKTKIILTLIHAKVKVVVESMRKARRAELKFKTFNDGNDF